MNTQRNLEVTAFHPLLEKWFAVRLYPFQDGLYAFGQDVTERTHAEVLLQFQTNTSWERKSLANMSTLSCPLNFLRPPAVKRVASYAAKAIGKEKWSSLAKMVSP